MSFWSRWTRRLLVLALAGGVAGLTVSLATDAVSRPYVDMTTRVIDVGAAALLGEERDLSAVDNLIWASLLKSMSAMGAYRRAIGPQVEPNAVVDFVLRDGALPRSVKFCLNGIREELGPLKHNRDALKLVDRTRRKLSRFDPHTRSREELHRFIDKFQLDLANLSHTIDRSWFMTEQAQSDPSE